MDHVRKLKFSRYVHLPSIKKMFLCRYALVILCNVGEVIIFEHWRHISALGHIRMVIFSTYVLLACINTIIWPRLGDLVKCISIFNFGAQELYI